MALIKNPDGSVTVSDDSGRVPTFVVPAETAATLLPPQPAPLQLSMPAAAPPVAAPQLAAPNVAPPQLLPELAPMPTEWPDGGLTLDQPVPGPAPQALSYGAVAGEGAGGTTGAGGGSSVGAGTAPVELQYTPGPGDANYVAPVSDGKVDPAELSLNPDDVPGPTKTAAEAPPAAVAGTAPAAYNGDIPSAKLAAELANKEGGYSPGRPASDVKKSFQVQKGVKTSPETLGLIETAFANRAGVESEGARAVPGALEQVALAHARAAEAAQQEVAAIRNRQRAQEAELRGRMKVLDSHMARINNMADRDIMGEYLGRQNLGTRIIVGLSAMASALTHSPDTVAERIKMELNGALQQQKMRVEAGHRTAADMLSAYGQMRSTYTSPEAAESAAQALMLQATQQTVLQAAARVNSEETRIKYLDVAGKLGIEYALLRQATEQSEADRIAESWKHNEAVAGGYSKPGKRSMLDRLKLGQKHGLTTDQIMALQRGEEMPDKAPKGAKSRGEIDLQKFVGQLQVQLPDGTVMYAASETRAKEAENSIKTGTLHLKNLDKIRSLAEKGASSGLPTGDKAKLETLIAENRYYLKGSLIKEALTAGEIENYKPMTAEEFLNVWRFKENAAAQLDQIQEGAKERIEAEKKTLYRAPLQPGSGYANEQKAPDGAVRKY